MAALTTTIRGLTSELRLGVDDGLAKPCVVSFDNLHTIERASLRRRVTTLSSARLREVPERSTTRSGVAR